MEARSSGKLQTVGARGRATAPRALIAGIAGQTRQSEQAPPGTRMNREGEVVLNLLLGDPLVKGGIALAAAVLLTVLATRRWGGKRDADSQTDTGLD